MKFIEACKAFWMTLTSSDQKKESQDVSHLVLLRTLQEKARFIDFIQEDVHEVADSDLGACVRKIHADCKKVLQDCVQIEPLLIAEEGSKYTVLPGFNAHQIKVTGHIKGEPPYQGTIVHRGWKAARKGLPASIMSRQDDETLMQAEVEVSKQK